MKSLDRITKKQSSLSSVNIKPDSLATKTGLDSETMDNACSAIIILGG